MRSKKSDLVRGPHPLRQAPFADQANGNNTRPRSSSPESQDSEIRDICVFEYEDAHSVPSTDPEPQPVHSKQLNFLEDAHPDELSDSYPQDNFLIYGSRADGQPVREPTNTRKKGGDHSRDRTPEVERDVSPRTLQQQIEFDPDKCRRHSKNLTAFCFSDKSFLCVECLLSKLHQKHHVVEISVALEARISEVARRLSELSDRAPTKNSITDLEKTLDKTFQRSIEVSKALFAEVRSIVDEEEKLFNVRTTWGH